MQESGLRLGVQLRGTISHRSEKDVGVLERKAMVDMGDGQGLREVIVIDWTPDDPGVSVPSGKGRRDIDGIESIQLVQSSQVYNSVDSSSHYRFDSYELYFSSNPHCRWWSSTLWRN